MRSTRLTIPELGLIAGTRGILGAGLGLLMSNRLTEGQRKAAGWALFLVGAISTIPLAFEVFGRSRSDHEASALAGRSRRANGRQRHKHVAM